MRGEPRLKLSYYIDATVRSIDILWERRVATGTSKASEGADDRTGHHANSMVGEEVSEAR